jgi:outer membrane immunogenic protein
MRKILLSAVASGALFSGAVVAADIPVKGPVYKAVPYYNWTGWYGGINAGYGWDPNYQVNSPGEATMFLPLEPRGGFFGVQLGYNWHYAPRWLAGIEADFQFADIEDRANFTAGGGGTNQSTAHVQLQHFATIRGRFGHVMDRTLIFVTGGVAFGHFGANIFADFDANDGAIIGDKWEVGYVVGAGVEYAFANNWLIKIEYQYLDFSLNINGARFGGQPLILTGDPQIHTVRLGLNLRFATGGN